MHPLTDDHLAKINASLEGIKLVQETINRAKLADLDIGDREERAKDLDTRLRGVKAAFFPGN